MVEKQWGQLSNRYPNICLHNFVVMPNHFHGIIEITNRINVGATLVVAPGTDNSPTAGNVTTTVGRATADGDATTESRATTRVAPTVGDVVGAFKSITTVEYIKGVNDDGWRPFEKRLWQRNYFEHIIRDEPEYLRIAEYIENNPIKWNEDRYYEEF
jgi:REP element-mobilizing transposase RayT